MVPVELSLSNFLSYGEQTRTLDFSRFHVACLSGKNGQGKSALLDAITWVLWGEARKSSGGHKPDDELIRIGARRMKVEFMFDAEDALYRVLREYSRSASGKTSKTILELQLLSADRNESRPLTGASIRETQEQLNEILGLDYHTFINSSFLLQGRSDEFTKKKPGERKEILARILNLGKYDRLALLARDKQRKIRGEIDVMDREIERLILALEGEAEWKAGLADTVSRLDVQQKTLNEIRQRETTLTERLGAIEARAAESKTLEEQIDRLRVLISEHEGEIVQLGENISEAQSLIRNKEKIESAYSQYEALIEERDELDTQRELFRGLERQWDQRKQEAAEKRRELERKIQKMEMERQVNQGTLDELKQNREERSKVEEQLVLARAAAERVEVHLEAEQRRKALLEEKSQLERRLDSEREKLSAGYKNLIWQIESLKSQTAQAGTLEERIKKGEEQKERHAAVVLRMQEVLENGTGLAEEIKQMEGEQDAIEKESKKISSRLTQLVAADESVCPTCGNILTEEHLEQVRRQLNEELASLESRRGSLGRSIGEHRKKREELRESFRELKKEEESGASIIEDLARLKEQRAALDRSKKESEELEDKAATLATRLEQQEFGSELKTTLEALEQKLADLPYNEDVARQDAFEAAQSERYEEKLRRILSAESKSEQLTTHIESLEKQIAAGRSDLDSGAPFAAMQNAIQELEKKMGEVGFDDKRFEAVRVQLKDLAGAHGQMRDLLHAKKNIEEWRGRRQQLQKRNKKTKTELEASEKKHVELKQQLHDQSEVERALVEMRAEAEKVDGEVRALQVHQGEYQVRLAQAQTDRKKLTETRKKVKENREEAGIYGKLRQAFGKNGIPSLIIEQTLPEVEHRTNELLERLTEGKMRVRLETLKDKKSGGTRETLEIIIADEQGVPRPYETFSGGEAFRVNFALRIALSQMLAERNGVRIRTLGIDEGFGTQDEDGIQNLIEAIQIIQNDFDKILVITHLARLKEAFPVRIEVHKDPVEGSSFTLIEG